uniref:Protein SERAC1 n=1 Tax=Parastrongyloides trichosuri TaxID=131310 RepID=A0A0N4ZRJ4_PARTI
MFNTLKNNYKRLSYTAVAVASSAVGISYLIYNDNEKMKTENVIFKKNITSVSEAFKLVSNKCSKEKAITFLENISLDPIKRKEILQKIQKIDNVTLCLLALSKSNLIFDHNIGSSSLEQLNQLTNGETFGTQSNDTLIYQTLNKIFNNTGTYLGNLGMFDYRICEEHDLQCMEEDRLKKYWANDAKIIFPLMKAVMATKEDDCKKYVSKELLDVLLLIFLNHREDLVEGQVPQSRRLCQLVIKILSNIAKNDKDSANLIINSEWFAFLSKMILEPISGEEPYWAKKVFHNILYSLKYETYPIPTDIIEIYNSSKDKEPIVDIVFLHGIQGSGLTTWRSHDSIKNNKTRCWLADWLLPELSKPVRAIATDYVSSFWFQKGIENTVVNRAKELEKEFCDANIGKRPIIFISHSLGGILLKKILTDNPKIRDNTVAVMFIAVPHRGSRLSSIFGNISITSDEVKFLKLDSEGNSKIHRQFLSISEDIPLFMSLTENIKHNLIKKYHMVPPESAYFERGSFYHLNTSHMDITKPKDKNDQVYILIKKFLLDGLKKIN